MFIVHLLFLATVSTSECLDRSICFYFVWKQVSKVERMQQDTDPWDGYKLPTRQSKTVRPDLEV